MGKMFGKPPIARKLSRIPSNFLFFAPFGGKCKLSSMHLPYVSRLSTMYHAFVCKL
jgi:hypothetical protein